MHVSKFAENNMQATYIPPPTSLYPPEALPGAAVLGTKRRSPPSPIGSRPLPCSCRNLLLLPDFRRRSPRMGFALPPLFPSGFPGLLILPGFPCFHPPGSLRLDDFGLDPRILRFPALLFVLRFDPVFGCSSVRLLSDGEGSIHNCIWHRDHPDPL